MNEKAEIMKEVRLIIDTHRLKLDRHVLSCSEERCLIRDFRDGLECAYKALEILQEDKFGLFFQLLCVAISKACFDSAEKINPAESLDSAIKLLMTNGRLKVIKLSEIVGQMAEEDRRKMI